MVNELKRNGSGYYDPTAYKAMKNIEKGEQTMKRGEIWEIGYGMEAKYAVIVSVQEIFCNVLVLSDESKGEHDVAIKATGMRYTNPAMLSYAYKDRFNRFIRAMRDDEFEELIKTVRKKLDLYVVYGHETHGVVVYENDDQEIISEKIAEIEALKVELEYTKKKAQELKEENDGLKAMSSIGFTDPQEVIVMKTQLEIYKEQNRMFLERLIGA